VKDILKNGFREDPLLPGSRELSKLQSQLADNSHVQAVEQFVGQTDKQALYDAYRGTGSKPYQPERLLAIALVMILQGVRSPAKWAESAKNDDRCKLVGRGIQPSRTTLYNFRDRAAKFIEPFHAEMIQDAIKNKRIEPTAGCLDGTFVAAAASRHKMFRLKQVSRRLSILKRAVASLDDPGQVAYKRPLTRIPSWLAKTPSGRQEQLERFRKAKTKILDEIRINRGLPSGLRRKEEGIKISPADIEAVIGKDKFKVTRPLYNVQYMCDFASDVILSYDVFRKKNDTGTLIPMIQKTQSIIAGRLQAAHADSGYCSLLELKDCGDEGVELFAPVPERKGSKGRPTDSGELQISGNEFPWDESSGSIRCPAGLEMKRVSRSKDPRADGRHVIELRFEQSESRCAVCESAGRCLASGSRRRTIRRLEDQPLMDAQKVKMESQAGVASNRRRKMQIERRYGDSKKHRGGGQFHGRNLERATAETGMMVVAQNCLTLYLLGKRQETKQT
jgi:transposase